MLWGSVSTWIWDGVLLDENGGSLPLMIGEAVDVDMEVPFGGGSGPEVTEPAVNLAGGDVPFAAGGVLEAVSGGREPFGSLVAKGDGLVQLPGGTVEVGGAVGGQVSVEGGQLVLAVVGGAPEAVGAVRQRVPGPHAGHFGHSPVLG